MKTLYRQFIGATMLILCISIVVAFLLANLVYVAFTRETLEEQKLSTAQTVVENIDYSERSFVVLSSYFESIGKLGYQLFVIDEHGSTNEYGEHFDKNTLGDEIINKVLAGHIYKGNDKFLSRVSMMQHFSNDVANTVGVSFSFDGTRYALFLKPNSQMLFSDFHVIIIGFMVSVMFVGIFGVIIMTRKIIKPLSQLTEATKLISKENFNFSLDIQRHDEIGQLAEAFHSMQIELKHNIDARKAFISNVSHDFQSPLMNIQGYAGLLLQDEKLSEEQSKYADIIVEEARRLSLLTKQLLLITSLDHDSYPIKTESVRVDKLLKSIIHKYQWRLEEKNIDITYVLDEIEIQSDPELLSNVWENLLINAIKYNVENGSISISCREKDGYVEVVFSDTGIGIPEEAIPYLFDRFYRVDKARKRDGTGLGLSIVQQSLLKLNGQIEAESKEGKGSQFKVKIKTKKE